MMPVQHAEATRPRPLLTRLLARGALAAVVLRIGSALASYGSLAILARLFSERDFGLFSLLLSIAIFLGTFANLGMQRTVIRFVGEYQAKEDPGLQRGVMDAALKANWWASILTILAGLMAIGIAWLVGIEQPLWLFAIALFLLPGFAVLDTNSAIARAYGSVFGAIAPREILWRCSLIPIAFLATSPAVSAQAQLGVFLIAAVFALGAILYAQSAFVKRVVPPEVRSAEKRKLGKKWKTDSRPFWASALAAQTYRSADVLLLAPFISVEALGGYFLASRLASLVDFIQMSLNMYAGPEVSRSYYSDNRERLNRVLTRFVYGSAVPAVVVVSVYAIFGEVILSYFSPGYAQFHIVLMILAGGRLISALCGPCGLLLDISGHGSQAFRMFLATLMLAAILMVLLASSYGALGAAIAVALSQALANLLFSIYAIRRVAYDPTILNPFTRFAIGRTARQPHKSVEN